MKLPGYYSSGEFARMAQSYKSQYQNASNISARIRLHRDFSRNPQGWFPWIFEQPHLKEEMKVLELVFAKSVFQIC